MGNLQERVAIVKYLEEADWTSSRSVGAPAPKHQGQGEGVSCRRGWADRPLGLGKGDGWNTT